MALAKRQILEKLNQATIALEKQKTNYKDYSREQLEVNFVQIINEFKESLEQFKMLVKRI